MLGEQLGSYIIRRHIGSGGYADVYLAEHYRVPAKVAIKVLKSSEFSLKQEQEFRKEARIIIELRHPHIIRVIDYGIWQDSEHIQHPVPYIVMTYAPLGNLRVAYPEGQRVPLDKIALYITQMADALQYAHDQQNRVVHCDIKPENMLKMSADHLILTDFGIAKDHHSTVEIPNIQDIHQGSIKVFGTPSYLPPERCIGGPVSRAGDQYSLAVVAYEWLTGHRPFEGNNALEIMTKKVTMDPPSIRAEIPEISQEVEDVIMKALAKEINKRYATINEFAHELNQALLGRKAGTNKATAPRMQPPEPVPPEEDTSPSPIAENGNAADTDPEDRAEKENLEQISPLQLPLDVVVNGISDSASPPVQPAKDSVREVRPPSPGAPTGRAENNQPPLDVKKNQAEAPSPESDRTADEVAETISSPARPEEKKKPPQPFSSSSRSDRAKDNASPLAASQDDSSSAAPSDIPASRRRDGSSSAAPSDIPASRRRDGSSSAAPSDIPASRRRDNASSSPAGGAAASPRTSTKAENPGTFQRSSRPANPDPGAPIRRGQPARKAQEAQQGPLVLNASGGKSSSSSEPTSAHSTISQLPPRSNASDFEDFKAMWSFNPFRGITRRWRNVEWFKTDPPHKFNRGYMPRTMMPFMNRMFIILMIIALLFFVALGTFPLYTVAIFIISGFLVWKILGWALYLIKTSAKKFFLNVISFYYGIGSALACYAAYVKFHPSILVQPLLVIVPILVLFISLYNNSHYIKIMQKQ